MNNERIEKKFVLGKFKEDYLVKFLILNGFTKQFPNREINSVYLDTFGYDFAKDNINGVSHRKKIRFRWYNDDDTNVFIEEKNKKNFLVWKNIEKIKLLKNKDQMISKLKKYFFSRKIENMKNFNYKFVLKTNYKRSYWISSNKKFRATIDIDINTCSTKNFLRPIYLPDTVLEFKFSPSHESEFRRFFNFESNGFRSQKYSKYIRSFLCLENSGLFV